MKKKEVLLFIKENIFLAHDPSRPPNVRKRYVQNYLIVSNKGIYYWVLGIGDSCKDLLLKMQKRFGENIKHHGGGAWDLSMETGGIQLLNSSAKFGKPTQEILYEIFRPNDGTIGELLKRNLTAKKETWMKIYEWRDAILTNIEKMAS